MNTLSIDNRAFAPTVPLLGANGWIIAPVEPRDGLVALLREWLRRRGHEFETDNDSEVAARYFAHRLGEGATLAEALEAGLSDLDGFYTFTMGTRDGFAVLRDGIACKPAIMAETDRYVAFGSEYRALAGLPGIENARIWEPEPATVYFWER